MVRRGSVLVTPAHAACPPTRADAAEVYRDLRGPIHRKWNRPAEVHRSALMAALLATEAQPVIVHRSLVFLGLMAPPKKAPAQPAKKTGTGATLGFEAELCWPKTRRRTGQGHPGAGL